MKIKDIMTTVVEVVHPDDTLHTAARKMRDRDVGFLPVYDSGELIGILTDRDLVTRAMANGTKHTSMIGRDIITSPGVFCFDDQDIEAAAELMRKNRIRRLVVVDRKDGRAAGVVSLGDIASIIDSDSAGRILQDVSEEIVTAR